MKAVCRNSFFVLMSLLLFVEIANAVEVGLIVSGTAAPNFRLNDQYIVVRELEEFRGTPVLILYTGRDAFEKAVEIEAEIQEEFNAEAAGEGKKSSVEVMVSSNMKKLPFFLKKKVKNALKKPEYPSVLLDWKGEIADGYGYYEPGLCAFIVNRDGIIIFSKLIEDEEDVEELMKETGAAIIAEG